MPYADVDTDRDPTRLIDHLDLTAHGQSGIKHYMAAHLAAFAPPGLILDIGCGAGHDLEILAGHGRTAIGVDPSAVMLAEAASRAARAQAARVMASGVALPLRPGSFAGVRMERVLMHVDDPAAVVAEAVRCLMPGGHICLYEPDWTRFSVTSDITHDDATWLPAPRQPDAASLLWSRLEAAGCIVYDRVEELSIWRSLALMDTLLGFEVPLARAVMLGRLDQATADRWRTEQLDRDRAGIFRATIPKILIVAKVPD